MRLTGLDLVGFAVGGVAVAFSGFVLSYSLAGGLAILAGGGLALALPFVRESAGSAALGVLAWLAVVGLLAAGIGGFLVGYGVFDEPDVHASIDGTVVATGANGTGAGTGENGTVVETDGDGSVVVATGEVTNAGDATSEAVTVTVTLLDDSGAPIRSESTRIAPLRPDTTQLFYVRFEGDDEMTRFDGVAVEVDESA